MTQIHDADGGIGFDMRNAHLYNDSDDDEDEVDPKHRPRPYPQQKQGGFGCCYVILIIIILALGSIIGYSLGSTFTAQPEEFEAATDPPLPNNKLNNAGGNKKKTPEPTRNDPFHKNKHGSITGIFGPKSTPQPTPLPAVKVIHDDSDSDEGTAFEPSVVKEGGEVKAFEPSAVSDDSDKAFEPSAVKEGDEQAFEPSAVKEDKAFEPSAVKEEGDEQAFEPSAVKEGEDKAFEPSAVKEPEQPSGNNNAQKYNDVVVPSKFDLGEVKKILNNPKVYNLDFNDEPLTLDDEYDLGDSAILTKIVLDGYEIPYIFENAHKFNVKYPNQGKEYADNQYRRWCFNFYLFDYPAAQIDVTFNKFQVERGFDRVLIRHFNQSFLDPPTVIAGRGEFDEDKYRWILPERIVYHLRSNEFKTICVEFESDDSIGLSGIDFNVDIKYDDCQWSEYTDCYIPDESNIHWDRGPFWDGLCGIGVHERKRTQKVLDKDAPPLNNFEAFVNCENSDETDIDGPDYCLKAPWYAFCVR